jgi:hypothetical protein
MTVGLASLLAGPAWMPVARAAPLDETACKTYDVQKKILEAQGLQEEIARGPDWAKANLSTSRLALIKHYLFVKEQVAFRCPSLMVVSIPELAEPEAKQPLAKATSKATGKSKRKDKKRKKAAGGAVPAPSPKATATQ